MRDNMAAYYHGHARELQITLFCPPHRRDAEIRAGAHSGG